MLAPVQDSVLDHSISTFLEKQYLFKQHLVVFNAKKVIGVSKWKTGFIPRTSLANIFFAFEIQKMILKSKMFYMKIQHATL